MSVIVAKIAMVAIVIVLGWIFFTIRDAWYRRKYPGYDDDPTEAQIAYIERYADAYVHLYETVDRPHRLTVLYIVSIVGLLAFGGGAVWLCLESFDWIAFQRALNTDILTTTEASVGPSVLFGAMSGLAVLSLLSLLFMKAFPELELFAAMSSTVQGVGLEHTYNTHLDALITKIRTGKISLDSPQDVRADVLRVHRKTYRWTTGILLFFLIPFAFTYAVDIRKTWMVTTDAIYYPAKYADLGQRVTIPVDSITTVKIDCQTDPFSDESDARYELYSAETRRFWKKINTASLDELWTLDQHMRSRGVAFEHKKALKNYSRFMLEHCLNAAIPLVPDGRAAKIADVFHLEMTDHELFPELAARADSSLMNIPPLRR